jgi:hypothetical protein
VSPVQGVHRLSYLQGNNLKEFEPSAPPLDYGLDDGSLREYLFTLLHNGLAQVCFVAWKPELEFFEIILMFF